MVPRASASSSSSSPPSSPSSSSPSSRSKKRTRNSTACMRCRELKKKCDNALPSCTRCSEFGAKCLYLTYEEYQQSLGETVVRLGRQLDEMQSYIDEMNAERQKYDSPSLWDGYESPETIEFYRFLLKTRQDYAKRREEVVLAEYDAPLKERAVQWHATLGAGGIMIETDIQTFGDLLDFELKMKKIAQSY